MGIAVPSIHVSFIHECKQRVIICGVKYFRVTELFLREEALYPNPTLELCNILEYGNGIFHKDIFFAKIISELR